jgi:hypothetical protein
VKESAILICRDKCFPYQYFLERAKREGKRDKNKNVRKKVKIKRQKEIWEQIKVVQRMFPFGTRRDCSAAWIRQLGWPPTDVQSFLPSRNAPLQGFVARFLVRVLNAVVLGSPSVMRVRA